MRILYPVVPIYPNFFGKAHPRLTGSGNEMLFRVVNDEWFLAFREEYEVKKRPSDDRLTLSIDNLLDISVHFAKRG